MELFRCLGSLMEPPSAETPRLAAILELEPVPDTSQHADLFLFQLFPFASVYLDNRGKIGGEARDRIAGFWRALELPPPPEPDHLAILLSFYGQAREAMDGSDPAQAERWRHICQAFLWEHLVSWLPVYLEKLRKLDDGFYSRWGELLAGALAEEAQDFGPQPGLSLHLREAAPLSDPRVTSGEDFVDSLLTPVRSGLILVRSDLQRAGRQLGLGVRKGERSYVLKALLGQDDRATLRWMAREATEAARAHRGWLEVCPVSSRFWIDRARSTSDLLTELASDLES